MCSSAPSGSASLRPLTAAPMEPNPALYRKHVFFCPNWGRNSTSKPEEHRCERPSSHYRFAACIYSRCGCWLRAGLPRFDQGFSGDPSPDHATRIAHHPGNIGICFEKCPCGRMSLLSPGIIQELQTLPFGRVRRRKACSVASNLFEVCEIGACLFGVD